MKSIITLCLCLLCFAVPAQEAARNVLFIMLDDLNDWVGVMGGHPDAQTPNMDRLAQRGMLFTNAHANSPVCNSSRASMMTGLLPSTTGIYSNGVSQERFIKTTPTMADMFKAQGYYTAGVGKLLHGFYYNPKSWHTFKKKFPDPHANKAAIYPIANQFKIHPLDDEEEANTMDALAVSWAIEQLNHKQDKPFFLGVGIYRPHVVWRVPKKFYLAFPEESIDYPLVKDDDLNDVGSTGFEWAMTGQDSTEPVKDVAKGPHAQIVKAGHWQKGMQAYLASIKHADHQVGRLLDALDASGHADHTIVVLSSDHGWHFGEKQHWRKGTLWEEATRVPLIISVPGMTKPGSRSHEAVSLVDLFPTLADLTGLNAPQNLQGNSLTPLLRDASAAKSAPAISEYYRGNVAIRDERYRLIEYANGEIELYDHQQDPNEWHNLASKPEFKSVIAQLSQWRPKQFAKELGKAQH